MAPIPWSNRAVALTATMVAPFLCYLARNRYSPLRPEALLAIALLLAFALALAAVARLPLIAFGLISLIIAVDCATLPAALWGDRITPLAGFALSLAIAGLACVWLQNRFLHVITVVAVAGYTGAVLTNVPASRPEPQRQHSHQSRGPQQHVLYLVLDEHLGTGAFPQDIPACASAGRAVADTFLSHQFTLHPNAYSNYAITLDSLPSVFNRRLLPHSHFLVDQPATGQRTYRLKANALCDSMRQRGLAVSI